MQDSQWPVQIFEIGADVVEPVLADNLIRLIAEGAGQDDDIADTEMRSQAVTAYMALLEKPQLPDILLQAKSQNSSSLPPFLLPSTSGVLHQAALSSFQVPFPACHSFHAHF